jgi:hypothetical protein
MAWDFTNWSGDTWNDLEQDPTTGSRISEPNKDYHLIMWVHANSNGTVFNQEVTANET